jgi:pimeloyl-ACP methyl ester carboxylesterase
MACLGRRIALDFTLEHPELVETLILSGSALSGFSSPATDETSRRTQEAYRVLTRERDRPTAVETLLEMPMWHQEEPVKRERLRQIFLDSDFTPWLKGDLPRPLDPPALGRLAEVRVPTLILVGDRDAPSILRISELLLAGIAGSVRCVIPGAGHLVPFEQPGLFNRLVLGFVDRHQPVTQAFPS